MLNNPTLNKRSCRRLSAEEQAIRDSLAPLAPFPGVLRQHDKSVSRQIKQNTAEQRSN